MSEEHRKKYELPQPAYNRYPFYQVKDYDDCLIKTLTLTKYGAVAGTTFAVLVGLTTSNVHNPQIIPFIAIRIAKYGLPLAGCGAMFAGSLCAISSIRHKDGPLNHFVAGLATGSVVGTSMKSHKVGWGVGLLLGVGAMLWKAGKIDGWAKFPGYLPRRNNFNMYRQSYLTSRPDPEGNREL